jgi:hypothetical protein
MRTMGTNATAVLTSVMMLMACVLWAFVQA